MERGRRERARSLARSLALLGPSEDPCGRPWRLTADVGPPPALAVASAAPRRPVGVPLSRPAVPFRSNRGWCAPVPRRGKGSAPRRHPAVAPGRSRLRARRVSSRRRSPLPRFRPRPPVRVPSYRVPARRFKDPGGVAFPSPGSGGRRGPRGAVEAAPSDSRSRGGTPPSRGLGAPLGRPWGSPPRARFAGASSVAGPVSVGPDPLPSCRALACLAGRPEANPSPVPPPPLRGRRVEGGPCRRQHFFSGRKETFVRLLAVDHSARASMKNAASCEN